MGTVLRFPAERVRAALIPNFLPEPASVLILPVVRVERRRGGETTRAAVGDDIGPGTDGSVSGGRRRRSPRG